LFLVYSFCVFIESILASITSISKFVKNSGVNEEKIFSNADLKSKYIELLAEKSVRKNQYFKRPSLLIMSAICMSERVNGWKGE
jgi:hypothetical protein